MALAPPHRTMTTDYRLLPALTPNGTASLRMHQAASHKISPRMARANNISLPHRRVLLSVLTFLTCKARDGATSAFQHAQQSGVVRTRGEGNRNRPAFKRFSKIGTGVDKVQSIKELDSLPPLTQRDDLPFFASWPVSLQNALRDNGGVRFLVNVATRTIAAPLFYMENPWCFPEFVRISGEEYSWLVQIFRAAGVIADDHPDVDFAKEAYGNHPSQVAQVMIAKEGHVDSNDKSAPLFIFMHGGAWGSGFPTMYRLLSLPFLKRGFRAIILGYRNYPDADVDGQIDDLAQAVDYFSDKYCGVAGSGGPVVLFGHSSGAHVSMLAAMRGRLPAVNALIAGSGVYDVERQLLQEKRMGVDEISPMSAANGFTKENFRKHSPKMIDDDLPESFPPTLIIHGEDDDVTPLENSRDFYHVLNEKSKRIQWKGKYIVGGLAGQDISQKHRLEILEAVGHQDVVTNTCLGIGRAQATILTWIESMVDLPPTPR